MKILVNPKVSTFHVLRLLLRSVVAGRSTVNPLAYGKVKKDLKDGMIIVRSLSFVLNIPSS